jgi:hypothetical protein
VATRCGRNGGFFARVRPASRRENPQKVVPDQPRELRSVVKPSRAATILTMRSDGQRYETEWERSAARDRETPGALSGFVYDPEICEVLYTAERMKLDAAKFAAVEFVATARFGPHHDLKPAIVAAMLVWEPV